MGSREYRYLTYTVVFYAGIAFAEDRPRTYVLGPDDQVAVTVIDFDEIKPTPLRIDLQGSINIPLLGRIAAGGMTVPQLEAEVVSRLRKYIKEPQVTISITEFRSQPVSVLGCVNKPGMHQ